MATKTSANVSLGITIAIIGILALAGFITTILFFSQKQRAQEELDQLRAEQNDYILETEKGSVRVSEAMQARGRESLVSHLLGVNRELASLAVGAPDLSLEEVQSRAADRGGVTGGSMLSRIQQLESSLEGAETALEREQALRESAQADAAAEGARIEAIEREAQQAVAQAQALVARYGSDVEENRENADRTAQNLSRQLDSTRDELETQLDDRQARIDEQSEEILRLREIIDRMRGETASSGAISPNDEFALVDGTIVGVDPLTDEVVISLGRGDKLVLGLTFVVYSEVGDISPDEETGEYRPGKATIEVTRIDATTARARVIDQVSGNPPVRGDVIANAVYDPEKVYKFVIEGYFDTDRDGVVTAFERDELAGLIGRWGGEVGADLGGDTDFLVLGERPTLPPEPDPNDPIQIFQRYVDIQREIARYDELFTRASQTRIPVLNTNRLRTLIGDLSAD